MYTVYQNSRDEGHNFDSFRHEMMQICSRHKEERRALAFAFILYDFENPQLWKVLNDNQYWLALNEISGEYLTVFSFNYKEEKKIKKEFGISRRISYRLSTVTTSTNPSKGIEELVHKYFGSDFLLSYPAILFFQVDNEVITDSLLIELKEELIEPAFQELKEYLKSSVEALRRIKPEDRNNAKDVFDSLERKVSSTRTIRKIKRVVKNGGNIVGLISSIKGLF